MQSQNAPCPRQRGSKEHTQAAPPCGGCKVSQMDLMAVAMGWVDNLPCTKSAAAPLQGAKQASSTFPSLAQLPLLHPPAPPLAHCSDSSVGGRRRQASMLAPQPLPASRPALRRAQATPPTAIPYAPTSCCPRRTCSQQHGGGAASRRLWQPVRCQPTPATQRQERLEEEQSGTSTSGSAGGAQPGEMVVERISNSKGSRKAAAKARACVHTRD